MARLKTDAGDDENAARIMAAVERRNSRLPGVTEHTTIAYVIVDLATWRDNPRPLVVEICGRALY